MPSRVDASLTFSSSPLDSSFCRRPDRSTRALPPQVNTHSPYGSWRPDKQRGAWGCERLRARDNSTVPPLSGRGRRLQGSRHRIRKAFEKDVPRASDDSGGARPEAADWLRLVKRRREAAALNKPSVSRAFGFHRYHRELRCADRFVEAVYRTLERAGRLHDTTLMITGDHGEGFMDGHVSDVGHGGTVYDTQSQIPFIMVGPAARGLPRRVPGIWSDTCICHTVLDALGLRPHPLTGSVLLPEYAHHRTRGMMETSQPHDGTILEPISVGVSDLIGSSLLSHATTPPRHAFMSCSFEHTCVGLRTQTAKWIWFTGHQNQLEAYEPSDTREQRPITAVFCEEQRAQVIFAMKTWLRAVGTLHRGAKVVSNSCPFDAPFKVTRHVQIKSGFEVPLADTHCCSSVPTNPNHGGRTHCRARLVRCPNPPPCMDHANGVKAARERTRLRTIVRHQREAASGRRQS